MKAAEVALGRQRAPQHEVGDHVVPYLRSANVEDGRLNLSDVKTMNFTPSEQVVFSLRSGDVLVTEGSGSRDAVGMSAVWLPELTGTVCFQNTLLRLRPRQAATDGRYLAWWARHVHGVGLMAAAASGANILHLSAETLRRLPIELPVPEEQRRIADFLDDQVTRIDQAVGLRMRQVELVQDSFSAWLEDNLAKSSASDVLSRATDPRRPIQYGIVLPGPDFPGGVPIVKGGDVAAHRMDPAKLNRTDPSIEAAYPRSRLVAGDILIAIRGSVGELAVVPEILNGANITQDAARIAPMGVDPGWLRWVLQTSTVQSRIAAVVSGATVRGINIRDLRRVRIPLISRGEQERRGAQAIVQAEGARNTSAFLLRSVNLLAERKRSLITAAVTGEFDVSTASTRASDLVTG